MDATYHFVKNFAGVSYGDLPLRVVETTKKQTLDFLGVALAGSSKEGASEILNLYLEQGGAPQSTVLLWGHRLPATNAAQVNATMAHSLDYDDVHEAAIMHPGVITMPVSLAMAEYAGGLSGKEFIRANALAADFICRLGLATRPGENIHVYGWHLTSIFGFMTAAATAGMILGLDEEQMVNAIGIAYHQSAGNGQCVKDGALTKRMGPGFAVRGGIFAALLAQKGVTGAKNCLEGLAGMYQVYHGGHYSQEKLSGELGSRFETENISIKPYPCCRGVHPSIDAALSLVKEYDISPFDVDRIMLWCGEGTYGLLASPLEVKAKPRNTVDAQFSIPWSVATAIFRRNVKIDSFSEAAIKNRDILELAARIRTEIDPVLSVNGIEPARVKITTKDGKSYTRQVDFPTGTPNRPLSYSECEQKFRDCIAQAPKSISPVNADRLIAQIEQLQDLHDVRELIGLTC